MKPYENPELLRELFTYDVNTGRLTHAEGKRGAHAGELADTFTAPDGSRRVSVRVQGKRNAVSAHRAAWAIAHGEIPDGAQVLHINGDKADNRLDNLKLVTAEERDAAKVQKPSRKGKRRAAPAAVVDAPDDEPDSVEDDDPAPEIPPPIKPLAGDDPRRQQYAELLAQAGRMTIPRLHPGDANSVMSQLATMLGAPAPVIGTMPDHAAAWRSCLLEQGLGDLLDGVSKQVLTIFFLLCWRDSAMRLTDAQRERLSIAVEGMTPKQASESRTNDTEGDAYGIDD